MTHEDIPRLVEEMALGEDHDHEPFESCGDCKRSANATGVLLHNWRVILEGYETVSHQLRESQAREAEQVALVVKLRGALDGLVGLLSTGSELGVARKDGEVFTADNSAHVRKVFAEADAALSLTSSQALAGLKAQVLRDIANRLPKFPGHISTYDWLVTQADALEAEGKGDWDETHV